MLHLLVVQVESDSGVGPYTEEFLVANCSYKRGLWYKTKSVPSIVDNQIVMHDETASIEEWYGTNSADCKVTVLEFKEQKGYFK